MGKSILCSHRLEVGRCGLRLEPRKFCSLETENLAPVQPPSVQEETEVQRRKVTCSDSHSQLNSCNEGPEWEPTNTGRNHQGTIQFEL